MRSANKANSTFSSGDLIAYDFGPHSMEEIMRGSLDGNKTARHDESKPSVMMESFGSSCQP